MIERILQDLSEKINANCTFLSKPCGVARLQRERVEKKVKVYAVVPNLDPTTCNKQPYLAMLPCTQETAICYFEVLDNIVTKQDKKIYEATATVRLVGWINTKRFENYQQGSIEQAVIQQLNDKNIAGVNHIELTRLEPKTAQIFQKYTYDEAETQYLMHPFDFFSIVLKITYFNAFGCAEMPILSQNQC